MAWSDEDSENLSRIANKLDPPSYSGDSGGDIGPVGAIVIGLVITFVITLPIGIVMSIAGYPPVYENFVFWPVLFFFIYVLWPKN